jgi:hypothetical protein
MLAPHFSGNFQVRFRRFSAAGFNLELGSTAMEGLKVSTVRAVLGVLFAVTYVLCVVWDALFPDLAMYPSRQRLFPGFGSSPAGLLIGLAEAVIYGYYAALVFVPVYNFFEALALEAGPGHPIFKGVWRPPWEGRIPCRADGLTWEARP